MRTAVICEPVRTPIGRYGGMFGSLTAVDLGVAALTGLLERTGVAAEAVDDVILGHCYPNSEAPAIGRVVALDAGLPVTVPGPAFAVRRVTRNRLPSAVIAASMSRWFSPASRAGMWSGWWSST